MSGGGLSEARLERMHDTMAWHVERGHVPGMVTLVARRDYVAVDVIGAKSVGGGPMRRDTIFRIASMTKPVAAVAAMILVEECALRLDDPVDALLPELSGRRVLRSIDGPLDDTVPAGRSITLRDLLTLRMGLGAIFAPPGQYPIQRAMDERGLSPGPEPARVAAGRVDEEARRVAAGTSAGRGVDVRHRLRRAGRPDLPRDRTIAGGVLHGANLRASRHARHRLSGSGRRN